MDDFQERMIKQQRRDDMRPWRTELAMAVINRKPATDEEAMRMRRFHRVVNMQWCILQLTLGPNRSN